MKRIRKYNIRFSKNNFLHIIKHCKPVQTLNRRINKSIYYELFTFILIGIVLAIMAFQISSRIFGQSKVFHQKHIDFDLAREEISENLYRFITDLYLDKNITDLVEYVSESSKRYDLAIYLTDNTGNVLASNRKDTLIQNIKINLEDWSEEVKRNNDRENYIALYPITDEQNIYYLAVKGELVGKKIYSAGSYYFVIILISLVTFFGFVFYMIRGKIRYIKYLSYAADEISKGDLNYQVEVRGQDELARVAEEMNSMEDSIRIRIEKDREMETQKKELITNLSHDLKTPLTIILGYLDIMKTKQYKTEEEREKYLHIAYDKTLSLQEMVLKLFELIKSDGNIENLQMREINISRLLRQLSMEYHLLAEEKGITMNLFIADEMVMVPMDIDKMTSAFHNLFSNAIKYCPGNGQITLTSTLEKETILITLKNTCYHWKEKDSEKIFEKFYRVDKARNSTIPGNGLGLAIVKNIIEEHNGHIWVEWKEEELYFYIRLWRNQGGEV